jgi:hypothetical protein
LYSSGKFIVIVKPKFGVYKMFEIVKLSFRIHIATIEVMNLKVVFGVSKRGGNTVIFRGFEYWKHREMKDGNVVWRCCKNRTMKCKATIITKGEIVVRNQETNHTHQGNAATSLARRAIGEMKSRLADNLSTPSTSQTAVMSSLPDAVLMALPKRSSVSRVLRRYRQKNEGQEGEVLPPIPSDTTFEIPERFRNFVLFDSGPSERRIIILGCTELLDGLARSPLWLADGTFKVVPSIFFQLYTIHFQLTAGVNPAAIYCLLPDKTRQTYDRLLDALVGIIPLAQPTRILTDFESAAVSAFQQSFPRSTISGCYFHLSQSILRKVNEVGLKVVYETDDNVRHYVRSFAALAHVPVDDVADAFDLLAESSPDVPHLDEVITYFEHT